MNVQRLGNLFDPADLAVSGRLSQNNRTAVSDLKTPSIVSQELCSALPRILDRSQEVAPRLKLTMSPLPSRCSYTYYPYL